MYKYCLVDTHLLQSSILSEYHGLLHQVGNIEHHIGHHIDHHIGLLMVHHMAHYVAHHIALVRRSRGLGLTSCFCQRCMC